MGVVILLCIKHTVSLAEDVTVSLDRRFPIAIQHYQQQGIFNKVFESLKDNSGLSESKDKYNQLWALIQD
ncbi:hypothetical protein L208DRAFT_1398505, partial [Tricholoma matsutake]